jgi:phosphatidylserine decarboxylase
MSAGGTTAVSGDARVIIAATAGTGAMTAAMIAAGVAGTTVVTVDADGVESSIGILAATQQGAATTRCR